MNYLQNISPREIVKEVADVGFIAALNELAFTQITHRTPGEGAVFCLAAYLYGKAIKKILTFIGCCDPWVTSSSVIKTAGLISLGSIPAIFSSELVSYYAKTPTMHASEFLLTIGASAVGCCLSGAIECASEIFNDYRQAVPGGPAPVVPPVLPPAAFAVPVVMPGPVLIGQENFRDIGDSQIGMSSEDSVTSVEESRLKGSEPTELEMSSVPSEVTMDTDSQIQIVVNS